MLPVKDEYSPMAIRFKVKEVAVQRGISQYRLAKASGIDERTVRKIFRQQGPIVVSSETLDRLAAVLHVDVSELLESDPPGPRLTPTSPENQCSRDSS